MEYLIKPATPDSARDIVELDKLFKAEVVKLFQDHMPEFAAIKERQIDEKEETKANSEEIRNGSKHVYLLESEGKVIGYIAGKIQDLGQDKKVKRIGYIDGIFILKEHRGNGMGKRLIDEMLNWFRTQELEYANLGVSEPNANAINFYNHLNFETIGRDMIIKI